ncbi:hypothetical protein HRbin40_02486 [bacterium HR40]|nr:hypothetical protein HRbin40_02486 [bacterium HR40]
MTAYLLAEIDIHDATTYERYRARTPELVARFGGRFLVRGGAPEWLEGRGAGRLVVIAFPSREAARRFWQSPEYRELAELRHAAAQSRVVLLDGIE